VIDGVFGSRSYLVARSSLLVACRLWLTLWPDPERNWNVKKQDLTLNRQQPSKAAGRALAGA